MPGGCLPRPSSTPRPACPVGFGRRPGGLSARGWGCAGARPLPCSQTGGSAAGKTEGGDFGDALRTAWRRASLTSPERRRPQSSTSLDAGRPPRALGHGAVGDACLAPLSPRRLPRFAAGRPQPTRLGPATRPPRPCARSPRTSAGPAPVSGGFLPFGRRIESQLRQSGDGVGVRHAPGRHPPRGTAAPRPRGLHGPARAPRGRGRSREEHCPGQDASATAERWVSERSVRPPAPPGPRVASARPVPSPVHGDATPRGWSSRDGTPGPRGRPSLPC